MIRKLRTERGLTITALADKAKVTRPYICHLEAGRRVNPALDVLWRIARALELTDEQRLALYDMFATTEGAGDCAAA
jgi:transcriptional regulator with XRE-family HTH domain